MIQSSKIKFFIFSQTHKWAFFSAIFWGIVANLYMFTNKISFHDDIGALFGVGVTYESGRWLLGIIGNWIKKLYGNYSLPVLEGLISILLIALTSVILVEVFEIQSKLNAGLAGAIMVLFPSVTSVFAFMYTAPYYYFALLITATAAYVIKRGGWLGGGGIGIILIGGSMGIYQAYFPLAAASLLGSLIINILSEDVEQKDILKKGIRYLLILILSLCFYLLATKISLYIESTELEAHRGINNMGKIPLAQYPALIKAAYMRWRDLMYTINGISCSPFAIYLYKIFTILFLITAIVHIVNVAKRNPWNGIMLIIMIVVFPIAANLIELMAPDNVVERMLYGFVAVFLLLLSLSERLVINSRFINIARLENYCVAGYKFIVALVMAGFISVYVCYANVEYFRMDFLQSQAKSYFTTLITQIKSADGYRSDIPVVFIGKHSGAGLDVSFKGEYYNVHPYSSYRELKELINSYTWIVYMERWCGFSPTIKNADDYMNLPEVKEMSTYPNEGSIKVVDDALIVKLS